MAELIGGGHRTIAFCRSRKGTELVAADVRRRLPAELADLVRPYRGGYLAAERREIEDELFGGTLRGVVATTALELGIDVGGLDACVLNGFPGTIASMWQQAGPGRARGAATPSWSSWPATTSSTSGYMAHPDQVFSRPPEPAVINPANPYVLHAHLACAAYEQPLGHVDERWWPGLLDDGVRALVLDDRLKVRDRPRRTAHGRWRCGPGGAGPPHGVGLRNGSGDEVRIALADGTLVGTVDPGRACRLVHPGAVYLHQGQQLPGRRRSTSTTGRPSSSRPTAASGPSPAATTEITILDEERPPAGRAAAGSRSARCEVRSQVIGYRRFDTLHAASCSAPRSCSCRPAS